MMHVPRRRTSWGTEVNVRFTSPYNLQYKQYTLNYRTFEHITLPGLLNFALWPLTVIVSDIAQGAVDSGEVWFAHIKEVWAHAAHWHFGDVSEGLTDGTAEDEHADLLIESRDVGVPYKRLRSLIQKVDPVAFSNDDLKGQKRRRCQWLVIMVLKKVPFPTIITHNS